MTDDTLFPPPPPVLLPIRGSARLFPVNRIFCVGRNYAAHAAEMGAKADKENPFYFTKSNRAVLASGATMPYPLASDDVHHEVELVAALGKPLFRAAPETALDAVFGYACGIDMTRRDLQAAAKKAGKPWDLAKDIEHGAVIGEIVPAAEIGHPVAGAIELAVNGTLRQHGDLADLVNSVEELLVDLSRFYHLEPGDLLYTGTPAGVGPIVPGDRLEGRIENVGTIMLTIGPRQ